MSTATTPMPTVPDFRPNSADYLADPYAELRRLRKQAPVWLDEASGKAFVLRFDDVGNALTDITRNPENERRTHFPANPFATDGPGHTRPRRVIAPTFTNRAVQRFRDRAQEIVDAALATKGPGDELRVVEEIGFPLPYHLTCQMLGVPEVGNAADLREWTWRSLELIDAFLTPERMAENLVASANLADHLHEVIEWKRDHRSDDLVSMVLAAADEGEVMRPEQVVSYVHTLYLAGMHTTVNQTALSLHALLDQRDQWDMLLAQPDLLENAVEELLRFEPTAQYMRRTCESDYEIAGAVIPSGTEVVGWIASANRDEGRWGPSADQLDITRADARHHIAFGMGPHVCVGSWLARMELQVVIQTLTERFPNVEQSPAPLSWTSNFIRGPEELVLTLNT